MVITGAFILVPYRQVIWRSVTTRFHLQVLDPHILSRRPPGEMPYPWWRHQMETFSALLVLCAGNSPVPVNSPHKGQWRGALMFYLIYAWINDWVNNREAGDLRRHRGHSDVIVMHGNLMHAVMIPLANIVLYSTVAAIFFCIEPSCKIDKIVATTIYCRSDIFPFYTIVNMTTLSSWQKVRFTLAFWLTLAVPTANTGIGFNMSVICNKYLHP